MFKKIISLLLAIIICSLSFAQIKYGFKIGATQSFVKDNFASSNQDMNLKGGFQIGATIDVIIKKNLSLCPSLQFTQKGYRAVEGNPEGPFYWSRNLSTSYLELPINVVYNVYLNKDASIFIGTGPVLGFGLFGKLKTIFVTTDSTQQVHTENSTSNQIFKNPVDKRIDLGWNFLVGLQYDRITFTANYNYGLLNIIRDGNHKSNNRSFALTVGYFMHK